jgi:hypothetical protein
MSDDFYLDILIFALNFDNYYYLFEDEVVDNSYFHRIHDDDNHDYFEINDFPLIAFDRFDSKDVH